MDTEQKTSDQIAAGEQKGKAVEMQPLAASRGGSGLEQQYLQFELDGKLVSMKLNAVSAQPFDSDTPGVGLSMMEKKRSKTQEEIAFQKKKEKKQETFDKIFELLPDSTNAWLYVVDDATKKDGDDGDDGRGCCGRCARACATCSDDMANKLIAFFVIAIQIAGYIFMTLFLVESRTEEAKNREDTCYGPYCHDDEWTYCMNFSTGGLTSVLLVGFLWADVVNTLSIMFRRCRWFAASLLIMLELLTAIACGYLVGVYSESDFDAIGGAVGILFVHDLDEKVFASMQVFRGGRAATFKKFLALILWIVISISCALLLACRYHPTGEAGTVSLPLFGTLFGDCKDFEFPCETGGECIWAGFVCNGVEDCRDGSDEGAASKCVYDNDTIDCPFDTTSNHLTFLCVEDGSCIPWSMRCDGVLDCPDGSDEARMQHCQEAIALKKCNVNSTLFTDFTIRDKYPALNDTYHKLWDGSFKCNNGQCIDAQYACDGVAGDCVDGSDEHPLFDKSGSYPFLKLCPYAELRECSSEELLCKVDGKCIGRDALCNGIDDCVDGSDEKGCVYDCIRRVMKDERYLCGGRVAKKVDDTTLALHSDTVADGYVLVTYTEDTVSQYFEGETGECVPFSWRCDGISDCPDGDDEKACKLFSCDAEQYTCPDSGRCIPKAWLCDGTIDCTDESDEDRTVCAANDVTIRSDYCTASGYDYKCQDSAFVICLYSSQMCNQYQDCPLGDDEDEANCDQLTVETDTSTYAPLTCDETATGSAVQYTRLSFTFTLPAEHDAVTMSACLTANQGPFYIFMHNIDQTEFLYADFDEQCQCTDGRVLLIADTAASADSSSSPYPITKGQEYAVTFYPDFTGQYAIKVDCGASASAIPTNNVCTSSGTNTEFSSEFWDQLYYDFYGHEYDDGVDVPTSLDGAEITCDQTIDGTIEVNGDAFFTFTPTVNVTLNGCASQFDTVFTVYRDDAGVPYEVGQNDDSCELQSLLTVSYDSSNAGSMYALQITGYGGTGGDYSVTMSCDV